MMFYDEVVLAFDGFDSLFRTMIVTYSSILVARVTERRS